MFNQLGALRGTLKGIIARPMREVGRAVAPWSGSAPFVKELLSSRFSTYWRLSRRHQFFVISDLVDRGLCRGGDRARHPLAMRPPHVPGRI